MKIKFLLTAILILLPSSAKEAPQKFSDLTIVVSSCDKYEPLWKPFFGLLFKYWPSLKAQNNNIPIKLIANTKSYSDTRVQTILIPNETSWSDTMIEVLNKVKTKYVLLILDDFFFNKPVDENRLATYFQEVKRIDAAHLQVGGYDPRYHLGKPSEMNGLTHKPKHGLYRATLQIVLWNKKDLLHLIKPGENVWEFEPKASLRSEGAQRPYLSVTKNVFTHLNAAYEGIIRQSSIDFVNKQGIPFDPKFPRDTDFKQRLRYGIKNIIRITYHSIVKPCLTFAKKIIYSLGSDW